MKSRKLSDIEATPGLIEDLYARDLISYRTRTLALDRLDPLCWRQLIVNLFLVFGVILTLSGIVFFCAYNWGKIDPITRLYGLQATIAIILLIATCFTTLEKLSGRILILFASILVGVFWGVFDQVYQTNTDAYQFFMLWGLLIIGWTLVSNFSLHWLLLLIIADFSVISWAKSGDLHLVEKGKEIIPLILIPMHVLALGLREYVLSKTPSVYGLGHNSVRLLLAGFILVIVIPPLFTLITVSAKHSIFIHLNAYLGIITLLGLYLVYRYKLRDVRVLALTIFAAGFVSITWLVNQLHALEDGILFTCLAGAAATLFLSALAVSHLRALSSEEKEKL